MIPAQPDSAADVEIVTEREVDGGWVFDVVVRRSGVESRHDIRLSWVDYEHWSHGAAAPERVVKAVVEAACEITPERELPARFDATTARRWGPGMDDAVRSRVGG